MPKLSTFRVSALADVAAQLRYGSRATLLREIDKAEALAATIEPAAAYPLAWLTFALTGYRNDKPDDNAVIPGEALLADLSVLVEHLCEDARLSESDLPDGSLSSAQLAERWAVSRKTLDRYRRRGLIARRVRTTAGTARLAFTPASIDAFESAHADALKRATRFTRIGEETEADLIRRARDARARHNWSLDRTARHLADQTGRTTEGLRQLLRRHDERQRERRDGKPIFDAPIQRDAALRARALRLARAGAEPADISAELTGGRLSRRQVTHLIATTRLRLLHRLELKGPTSPVFERDDAETVLLAPPAVRTGLLAQFPAAPLADWLPLARAKRPDDAETERTIATAYHYLRARAHARLTAAPTSGITAATLDEIEADLRWAMLARARLLGPQLGTLTASLESRLGRPLEELGTAPLTAIITRSVAAAGHALDRFSPFRGTRLAAGVGLAVAKVGSAWASASARAEPSRPRAKRTLSTITGALGPFDFAPSPTWAAWLLPPPRLPEHPAALPQRQASILTARFGLDGTPPRTMADIAASLRTSPMHAARSERAGLRTIAALASDRG